MPDNGKKDWKPADLYTAPKSFEEDNRKTVVYNEPQKHGKIFYASTITFAIAAVALVILVLVGIIKLPTLPKGILNQPKGSNGVSSIENTSENTTMPLANMPIISEVMTNNDSAIVSMDGKYYDWVELYNPTDHSINLSGFVLSNNVKKSDGFILPDYTLDSKKFVVIFASGKKSKVSEIHATFKLKASGLIILADPNGKAIQQVAYPSMPKDNSYSIDMNDFSKWTITDKYSPGYPNTDEGHEAYQSTRNSSITPASTN